MRSAANIISIVLTGLLCFSSCEKSVEMIDCAVIEERLNDFEDNFSTELILQEVAKLCVDLEPAIKDNDPIGHEVNFNILIERLNENCTNFYFEKVCYACIKTLPAQSEIKISGMTERSSINSKTWIIDITTSKNDRLIPTNIHQ